MALGVMGQEGAPGPGKGAPRPSWREQVVLSEVVGPVVPTAHLIFFSWSERVKAGASNVPVLPGRHSAKSGMCVTRDHRVTHTKGGLNDSLRAQEKNWGWEKKKKKQEKDGERKSVISVSRYIKQQNRWGRYC